MSDFIHLHTHSEFSLLDGLGKLDHMHVLDVKSGNDEIEVLAVSQFNRFSAAAHVCYLWGVAEVKVLEFLTDELVKSPIFFEEVLIVQTRNQEDVPNLEPHQFLKRLDARVEEIKPAYLINLGHALPFA